MQVRYIVQSKYANGDDYMDKVDSLDDVAEIAHWIDSSENGNAADSGRILASQFSVTTEEV